MTLGSIFTQAFSFPSWNPSEKLPDLSGKVALVTGASTGLGLETALELARKGAKVYCLGRSKEKTMAAIEKIKAETKNDKVEFLQADLMDLPSVEAAADQFLSQEKELHILVNNAGIMSTPWALTKQGIESQFGTNHFAHAVLTNKLLKTIKESQPSRIVNLSSLAHTRAPAEGIVYEKLNDQESYEPRSRYGETKMANLHFTAILQQKFGLDSKVYVNAVHPGIVKTELARNLDQSVDYRRPGLMKTFIEFVSVDSKKGALTQIFCAAASEIETGDVKGKYFVPYCAEATPNENAFDLELAQKTWDWTREVLQKQFRKDWDWSL